MPCSLPSFTLLDAPEHYTSEQASAWAAGARAVLETVVASTCAECGKTSTTDSMWALYCVGCIEDKIVPALASEPPQP